MSVSWGYSPKVEKFIPLGDFPADKYLIVAQQAIENLGWKLSHLSETGLIAYTTISFQSYSEEISIRIHGNFAVVKSECVGIQMFFNDYGKNDLNLEKFFHEFEYVEFHLKDVWDDRLAKFNALIAEQDDLYFEKAPLATKNKIKNVLYLFFPQKGYTVTPALVIVNVLYFIIVSLLSAVFFRYLLISQRQHFDVYKFVEKVKDFRLALGVNHRNTVLNGQFWRLVTHQFIHGSVSHLFFNMYALIYLGLMIENKLGWKKYLFIYLLSGVCGGLISLTVHQESIMMGASGAIMGLYGAFIALLVNKTFEKKATQALLISTLIVSFLVLLNGSFGKRVDNAAHIGGFVSGFIFCYLLTFKLTVASPLKNWIRYAACPTLFAIFFAGIIIFSPKYQTEEFKVLTFKFNRNLENLNAITRLKIDLPKDAKLKSIKEDGIEPMEKNLAIIKRMDSLVLKKEDAKERDRKVRLGKASYRAVMLMYSDIKGDSTYRYSKQTSDALSEMFTILYRAE
ncbi:rhomboid family intramembrane serine protease [Pedobacter endophyticus]|uniref:Rhomboid family intramembrane serine protease n=1 Tax=Pedobacter endophyticus TaxID=2789740 RepID=A0A7U3Q5N7_9SPHI|nr:rhomboid family intramembrane serine protease [Pedobacter endophyticus]QPH38165.1 rhomboid family intramembrane serine protease [Pedobacter endophyticus]